MNVRDPAEGGGNFAVARATAVVSLAALAALCALVAGLDAASRAPSVIRWLRERQVARFEAARSTFEDVGVFESFEERLLHEEIPSLPAGRPFLGLFGSSNTKQSILRDELPGDLRHRFHVIATGGCTARMLERLVLTLEREKGILRPHSTLVLGIWWGVLSESERLENDYLRYPAERHGMWHWGPEVLEPAGGLLRPLRLQAVRLRAARLATKDRLATVPEALPPEPGPPTPELVELCVKGLVAAYGAIRVPGPTTEILERTLARIKGSGARVAVVEMPAPSWLRSRPEQRSWESWIALACDRLDVPRLDLAASLPDEEFYGDYTVHPRVGGRRRLQQRIVGLVRELEAP
jgi:hypothetical protein